MPVSCHTAARSMPRHCGHSSASGTGGQEQTTAQARAAIIRQSARGNGPEPLYGRLAGAGGEASWETSPPTRGWNS